MKVNFKNNYLLAACVLVLLLVCWMSVSAPIRFEREQGQRETAVKERLLAIRKAEEQYRRRHGTYTGDWPRKVLQEALPLQQASAWKQWGVGWW